MGPVIKTYGGYQPKRKGLPKFVKQTLDTTGNAFSALHIDNLKAIKACDGLKQKKYKVTKTTAVRKVQPTLDDSLNSTFDKIFKSDKNKPSDEEACLPLEQKTISPKSADHCWTCGCIPTTNMAHHVLFECKEDSYYTNPSPRTEKAVARKLKQSVNKKMRRRQRMVQESSPKKALKKEKPVKKPVEAARGLVPPPPLKTDIAALPVVNNAFISPVKSPFKAPLNKGLLQVNKPSFFMTSTPNRDDRKPKFSIQTSPISVELPRNINVQELAKDVQRNSQKLVKDLSGNLIKSQDVIKPFWEKEELEVSIKPEVSANVLDEQKPVEEISRVLSLLTDDVQNEQKRKPSGVSPKACTNESCDLIETSIVQPLHRPSGYITKRRMWRRTRRFTCNLSVDMFKSITKSTFDDMSAEVDATSLVDNLKVETSRNDKFFHSEKKPNTQQHFSISIDVKNVSVKLGKIENNIEKPYAFESNMECNNSNVTEISEREENVIEKHSNLDLSTIELSRELKVRLSLLSCEDKVKDSAQCNYDSDVDMFSESSFKNSMYNLQSSKSNVLDLHDQRCATPASKTKDSVMSQLSSSLIDCTPSPIVKSLSVDESARENRVSVKKSIMEVSLRHDESVAKKSLSVTAKSLDVDESLRHSSLSDDISRETDVSFEVVLKPCYIKLLRFDTQTIANVTYASHRDVSLSEDEHEAEMMVHHEELSESNLSTHSNAIDNSLSAIVELPLSLLGKLDKITIRGSTKTSQSSFDSVIKNGRLLEQSIAKLAEILTEQSEAAKEHHEVGPVHKNTSDDFSEVLSRCGQTEPLPFMSCYPESMRPKCRKIGEGAYGEVFLFEGEKQTTVIKIIPIEGDIEINAAVQKKFWEIKPEVIVAQELSKLRKLKTGKNSCDIFNEVLAVRCVRGKYPQWILDLWHAFDEEKGSENDCPDVFGDEQLYIVLELAHGGQDLESYEFTSAEQAVASITQIAFALAVGESEIQFEHRDLHWGNVLVAPTRAKAVQFTLGGEKYKVTTKGVKVCLIDFTMSRMTMPENGENMFYDFGYDEELFAAQGDYQCDIYRLMRERTRNNWSVYEPFTNILWLHYLLDKMCSMVAYRNQTTKIHQQSMLKLQNMRDSVLAYASATAFSTSEFFKSSKVR